MNFTFSDVYGSVNYTVSAKVEAIKIYMQSVCYLCNSVNVPADCREPWFILSSLTLRGSMLLLECILHCVPMVYFRALR